MAKKFASLTPALQRFIAAQQVFFVGTAAATGQVNVSPKGRDSLRVLGPNSVAWLNGTGSGNETAAHLGQVNRMTIMFCAFTGPPKILRLYGPAEVHHAGDARWDELLALFPPLPAPRNIFVQQIELAMTSCGFGVPRYDYVGERAELDTWADGKGPEGIARYRDEHNRRSLDGFPTGLPAQP